jgi:transposase
VEILSPYAPDLNPVDWIWRHVKKEELANLACLDLEELHQEYYMGLARIRERPRLSPSVFEGASRSL